MKKRKRKKGRKKERKKEKEGKKGEIGPRMEDVGKRKWKSLEEEPFYRHWFQLALDY